MKRKKSKIVLRFLFRGIIAAVALIIGMSILINQKSKKHIFKDTKSIPHNKAGLLLGTSKSLRSGAPNLYFVNRITAAHELFDSGKIDVIVISGDNSRSNYNEPQDMKDELVKRGIPADKIYLDYAGLRTFDSVYRIKEIFSQDSFTVISQEFHNQRAVYTAKSLGLNAVGYNAKDVDAYYGFKTKVREKFARVKVLIDLAVGKKPKFLGEKIAIE